MTSAKYLGISFVIIAGLFIPARIHAAVVSSSPIVTATSTCSTGLSCGLVGYWTFDGKDMSNGRVLDKSGNGNSGSLISIATSTFYVPGKMGQAFRFDGVDDYIILAANPWNNTPTAYSICSWVMTTTVTGFGYIINWRNSVTGDVWFMLDRNTTSYRFIVGDGTNVGTASASGVAMNKWTYLCGVRNNNTLLLYVDGILVGTDSSKTFGTIGSVYDFVIGAESNSHLYKWNGSLDDVRIYNRALSATEVKQLYNLGTEGHLSVAPPVTATSSCSTGLSCGLVGYWTFDGKDRLGALTYVDRSGNGDTFSLNPVATSTFYIPGKIGQAFNFDGVDDVGSGTNTSILSGAAKATWSLWFKPNSTSATFGPSNAGGPFLAKYQTNNGSNQAWYITQGGFTSGGADDIAIFFSSGVVVNTTGNFLVAGRWHHLVITYDGAQASGSKVKIYVNGVLKSNSGDSGSPATLTSVAIPAVVGASWGPTGYYPGAMDDVRIYNRALSATEVKQLYNLGNESHQAVSPQVTATSTCSTGLSCGLVGYWTFDGKDTPWTSASAGTTLDKSGSGGTGTLTGMSQVATPGFGKYGQALNFRGGVGEYVNVADANRYSFGNGTTDTPFSLSAWIYYDTSASGSYSNWPIITKWTDLGNAEWSFYTSFADLVGGQSGNGLTLQINKSGDVTNRFIVEGRTPVPNKRWSHVVATYDGSSTSAGMKVYLNGVQETTDLFTAGTYTAMSNLAAHVDIGGLISNNSTFDSFAKGKIDDVRIYNRALSATEIRQLYNGGR